MDFFRALPLIEPPEKNYGFADDKVGAIYIGTEEQVNHHFQA
jgi:hypothetical protein